MSCISCHMSYVTCYVSHVMRQVSCVLCHFLFYKVTDLFKGGSVRGCLQLMSCAKEGGGGFQDKGGSGSELKHDFS